MAVGRSILLLLLLLCSSAFRGASLLWTRRGAASLPPLLGGAARGMRSRGVSLGVQANEVLSGEELAGFGVPNFPLTVQLREGVEISVEKADYKELHAVAKLLVQSFYEKAGLPRVLSELNRLQSNFHYDDSKHLMLTAKDGKGAIIAYCDIDGRIPPKGALVASPRPYLSDLGVSDEWRKKGIATALVQISEAVSLSWGFSNMHLKVDRDNHVARNMYANMGYTVETPEGIELRVQSEEQLVNEAADPSLQFASSRLLCCKKRLEA